MVMVLVLLVMVEVWLVMFLVIMVSLMLMLLTAMRMLMVVLVTAVGSDCGSHCCNQNEGLCGERGISIKDHRRALRSTHCMSSCLPRPWLGTRVVMD